MHRQDKAKGQSYQDTDKKDTVLHRAGVGSAAGTRTSADRAADPGAEVASLQSSPRNITTALVSNGVGWIRDLTTENIEPNPGPVTVIDVANAVKARISRESGYDTQLDNLMSAVEAKQLGATGVPAGPDDIREYTKNTEEMTTTFKTKARADYIIGIITEELDKLKQVASQDDNNNNAQIGLRKRQAASSLANKDNKLPKIEDDWQSVSMHIQSACDGSLEFVEVGGLECSGLSSAHSLLYVREDAQELWKKLTSSGKSFMKVIGPPGVGKSTIVWAYACYEATKQTVYWIHFGRSKYIIAILSSKTITHKLADKKAVRQFINTCEDGILIVDGLTEQRREETLVACNTWRNGMPSRRLIVVSSESLVLAHEDEEDSETYKSCSWLLHEFFQACKNDGFFGKIRDNLICHDLDPLQQADEAADDAREVVEEANEIVHRLTASLQTTKQQLTEADSNLLLAQAALTKAQQHATTSNYQSKIATKSALEQEVKSQREVVDNRKGKPGVKAEREKLATFEASLDDVITLEKSVYKCSEDYNTAFANQAQAKTLLEGVEKELAGAPQRVVDSEKKLNEAVQNVLVLVYTEANRKAAILKTCVDPSEVEKAKLELEAAEKAKTSMVTKWGALGDLSAVKEDDTLANKFKMCITAKRYVLLQRKFSVVGGSVRWMFGMSDEEALLDINEWIRRCRDFSCLLSLSGGSSSIGASNHLLGCTKGGEAHYIQSRYVVLKVAERTTSNLVQLALNSPMCDNPAWKGWVFQLNFFAQLQNSIKGGTGLVMITPVQTTDTWQTHLKRQNYYHDPTDFCGPLLTRPGVEQYGNKLNLQDYDWLIPTRWNQGCFDVLQILPKRLRVVQVTIAKTHSLKLRFILKVVKQLTAIGFTVEKIDVYIVVPEHNIKDFKLADCDITGSLDDFGWKRSDIQVRGISYSYVDTTTPTPEVKV